MKTTVLALSELSCGHCVKRVQEVLSKIDGVEKAEVSLDKAVVVTDRDPQVLIDAIVEAGYQAKLGEDSPKPNQLPKTDNISQNPDPAVVEAHSEAQDQVMLLLEGLSCVACVNRVEKALYQVPQVSKVQINLAEQTALVFGKGEVADMISAVQQAGYGAELLEDEQTRREKQQQQIQYEIRLRRRQGIIALGFGAILMLWGMFGDMSVTEQSRPYWLMVSVITLAIMMFTGGHFYQRAVKNLRKKTATMDTLVALGTGAAWLYSFVLCLKPDLFPYNARHLYFEASAMIIGFINFGKMLEAKAKQRSSNALQRLVDLTPNRAIVVDEQGEREIAVAAIKQGMTLRLKTGDRVAVDGIVSQGSAWLDESMLTGEPLPVEKQAGDKVIAGTLVSDGSVLFQAEHIGDKTTLANIIRLVRQAQSSKPQLAQLADKIAAVFVPVVISLALLAGIIWYAIGPQPALSYALVVFTTVLIIACPCALGLATPMSIIAGIGRAAELGVLVRDADALQKAASADTLVFDKTGTLTKGEPKVTTLYTFNTWSAAQILGFAATLEQNANHPLAKAIVDYADEQTALKAVALEDFRTLKGLGVSGVCDGQALLLGNRTLMTQQGIDLAQEQALSTDLEQKLNQGATLVYLAVAQQLAAIFAIQDPIREDSREALQRLTQQGYHLVMLTGDQAKTAQAIAAELGIKQVIAGVLPEGKADTVKNLQAQGRHVVMIGDGINDAPALAQADVSIAMGSGSDIAIETAELTLMRHSISAVADALVLSKGILHNMKQNLFGAFIYNILGIPLAAGVLYPVAHLLLNPMWAGLAMALSSITVVSNANRLLKFNVNQ
ncbi:MAG: heavy metal translocating P-type ATPase [[Pasteurella] mairii]|uniref:Copper-exporting P-type ATPase n=1 Tax=[Pasteurella] mairii TaxID=757 RepID=A0A379B4F8_9PAST|nr:heavy metal translocating P-type ATPase [[Pasteurella] mairii]SUB33396.1 cation-transporting ATPase [[Pasteurella] mairii]